MHPLRRTALAFHIAAVAAVTTAATLLAAGCVTINIYFPAAAVEKAADRIIDEIYQSRKDASAASPGAAPAPAPAPAPAAKSGETPRETK